jgi:hypothetical protein
MIHTMIFATLVLVLSGLWGWAEHVSRAPTAARTRDRLAGPWRAVRWVAAGWRYQLARLAADVREAAAPRLPELRLAYAGGPEPAETACPRCAGRRCWYHRNGLDCPPQQAPKMTDTLGGTGVHEPAAVLRRIVPGNWSPLSTAVRYRLAPTAWSIRLGVPMAGVLP